jgi:hypothetical protein
MFYAWHSSGEDVIVGIPDELDARFKEVLGNLNVKFE